MAIPWLADVLREAGVEVIEEGDWQNHYVDGEFEPFGVLWHHTAGGPTGPDNPAPSLETCIHGREDLPGPLCHAMVDWHGVFHVISAGRANHAGESGGSGPIPAGDGNAMLVGWEIDYDGVTQEMSPEQYEASKIATVAVLHELGTDAEHLRGHKETTVGSKIDPEFVDLDALRAEVADMM